MSIINLNKVVYEVNNNIILDKISLNIEQGEAISIIGESGSGKSTILKVLSDLIKTNDGSIKFLGQDYTKIDPIKLRKDVSYCVQIPILFGKTVYDNFKFVFDVRGDIYDDNRVKELLEKFSLSNDYVNKDINSLSGGEKQRIALIRNLIYIPKVLLLDEVTSALDNENTKIVEEYIKDLNQEGVTIIWVTHSNSQSLRIFDKRIVMSKGKIDRIEIINQRSVAV